MNLISLKSITIWFSVLLLSGFLIVACSPSENNSKDDENGDQPPDSSAMLLEYGTYLAEHVMLCADCHSQRDFSLFGAPIERETIGGGGEEFNAEMAAFMPGTVFTRNITPYGVGDWTDEQLETAIRTGINADGDSLFFLMPWMNYRNMDAYDMQAIIAWVRNLESIELDIPEPQLFVSMTQMWPPQMPPLEFESRPDGSDKVALGKYLTIMASCSDCHTPFGEQGPMMDQYMGGGLEFNLPGMIVRPANLTPDTTGILGWSEDFFVSRFKQYDNEASLQISAKDVGYQTFMPWQMYAGMAKEELSAIYAYLRTIPPVKNRVEKFTYTETVENSLE